jgi:hypothetical protein
MIEAIVSGTYTGIGTTIVGVILTAILAALGWILSKVITIAGDIKTLVAAAGANTKNVERQERAIDAMKQNQTELSIIVAGHQSTLEHAFPPSQTRRRAEA